MLELKHPLLQKDPVIFLPTIQDRNNDLDEYATKLDTYFSAESLEGRPFSAR